MLQWSDILDYPKIIEMGDKETNVLKGYAFEYLIYNLCLCMFNLPIEHTPLSNDKGKDLVIHDGENNIWVECKNYKDTIGTHVVSNTLVMAMLENVKKIYVFSKSKISDRMVEELLEYSKLTCIDVTVLSDKELEKQIIKYRFDPRLEFDRFFKSGIINNESDSQPFDFYITTDKSEYFLGEIVTVSAIIKNTYDCEKKNSFTLHFDKMIFAKAGLEFISSVDSNVFSLDYCKVHRVDFRFRIAKYNKTINIPYITVSDSYNNVRQSNDCKISCNRLVRSYLIGESLNIVKKFSINKSTSRFVVINGKSGVGKSRLLDELDIAHMKLGYRTLRIDLENISNCDIIRKIVSTLYNLPFVHIEADYIINDTQEDIHKILYERNYDFETNSQLIADIIYEKIVTEKCFIGLDNVQAADSKIIDILNLIIGKTQNENINFRTSILCLVFNTERLMPEENIGLNIKLREMTHDYYVVKPFNDQCEIAETSKQDTANNLCKQFIFSCLNISSCDEEQECLFLELAKNCSFIPLDMQETLQYIVDNNIIKHEDNTCFICNKSEFNKVIHDCIALETILKKRYTLLLKNCSKKRISIIKNIINLLCYFNELSKYFLISLFNDNENILKLVMTGFVIEQNNAFAFSHSKIREFFKKQHNINEDTFYTLPSNLAKQLYEATSENDPIHWCAKFDYQKSSFERSDADKCLTFLYKPDCEFKFMLIIYRMTLFSNLFNLKERLVITSKLISIYEKKCGIEKTLLVFGKKLNEFEQIADECIQADAAEYIDLIRKFANKYILLHNNKEAYRILVNALEHLQNCNMDIDHRILSILYNRISVCAGSQNQHKKACSLAKLGLKEAIKINDLHNIIENLADLGYSYYKLNKRMNCIKTWKKINKYHLMLLNNNNYTKDEKKFSVYKCDCNRAFLNMIQQSKDAEISILHLQENVTKIERPFYRIKACLLIATYYIIKLSNDGNVPYNQFFNYLTDAQFLINEYGDIRSLYKVDYLYANYYYVIGQTKTALFHYKKAFAELEKAMLDLDTFASYLFLFYDLKSKIKILSNTYEECKNKEYELFYSTSVKKKIPPVGLLSNRKHSISFPII